MQHSFLKPRRWQWRSGLVAIPCLAFHLATQTGVAGAFTVETLDNQHLEWPALAIDAQGNSHIACYSWSSQGSGLSYGLKTETGWTQEWVPGASGYDVSIAVDANGGVHATYYDAGNLVPLRYASRTPSGWSQETIDIVGPPDQVTLGGTSLAIDSQGRPHVAYSISGILKYAERTSNGWIVETVDGSGAPMPNSSPALALDPLGNPHISYSGDSSLRIAERSAGQWSTETVASAQGLSSALAVDSEGRPHLSWTDVASGTLRYAERDGHGWNVETIAAGYYPSLALDAGGTPHISFQSGTVLMYASRSAAQWTTQTVDGAATSGYESSLAFDPAGRPNILYEFHTPYHRRVELRYAQGEAPTTSVDEWSQTTAWFGPVRPSPTHGTTAGLSFRLPRSEVVTLEVFDVAGRLAATRPPETFGAGEHVIRWDTGLHASGLYFVRMRSGAGTIGQQRWVLLR